jgi:WD40 repeat protein
MCFVSKFARLMAGLLVVLALVVSDAGAQSFTGLSPETNPNSFPKISYAPDGHTAAMVYTFGGRSRSRVVVFDVKSHRVQSVLNVEAKEVSAIAFSQDGAQMATAASDRSLGVWDLASQAKVADLDGQSGDVNNLAFGGNGRYLASAADDRSVQVWDLNAGRSLVTLRDHDKSATAVAFNADGTRLISGSMDGTVKMYELPSGHGLHTLRGHDQGVTALAVSQTGDTFASASVDRAVCLWSFNGVKPIHQLSVHREAVQSLAFSPDGRYLLSGDRHDTIIVWHASSGVAMARLATDSAVSDLHFSADGKTFHSMGVDRDVTTWDFLTRQPLETFRPLSSFPDAAPAARFPSFSL